MDVKNTKLLYHLDYDARASLAQLSKKLNLSKQNINYKIKKLQEQKIIDQYITVIDVHRLGFLTYRAYIRLGKVTDKDMQEIVDYFKKSPYVLWLVSITGTWDYEIVFVAKNYIEFATLFGSIKQYLGDRLVKYNISMSIVNLHYKKDYLLDKKRKLGNISYYGYEPEIKKIDQMDIKLLIELTVNCRRSNQEIGKKLGVSYHTVKSRIARMQKEGIIQSHRTKIHIQKLGYKHMKAALYLNPISEQKEKELATFISSFSNVTYVVKILGEWQIEIEADVEDENKFTEILRIVRNKYPDIINDYYTFQVTREIKLDYFPNAKLVLEKFK